MNVFNNPLQDAASKINLVIKEVNNDLQERKKEGWSEDKYPPSLIYSKYLQIASHKFRLSIDECRNKYGLYTIAEWNKLLTS